MLNALEGFTPEDMNAVIRKFDIRAPLTGNEVTEPVSFNLMFPTQIGPTGDFKAFLRPETAQGIFINFKRLLEFNQVKTKTCFTQRNQSFRANCRLQLHRLAQASATKSPHVKG